MGSVGPPEPERNGALMPTDQKIMITYLVVAVSMVVGYSFWKLYRHDGFANDDEPFALIFTAMLWPVAIVAVCGYYLMKWLVMGIRALPGSAHQREKLK